MFNYTRGRNIKSWMGRYVSQYVIFTLDMILRCFGKIEKDQEIMPFYKKLKYEIGDNKLEVDAIPNYTKEDWPHSWD